MVDAHQLERYAAHRLDTAGDWIEPSSVPPIFPGTDFISKRESPYAFHLTQQMYRPRDQSKSDYRKKCEPREFWLVTQVVGEHGRYGAGSAIAFQKSAIAQTAIAIGLALE